MNILDIRDLISSCFSAVIDWFSQFFSSIEGSLSFLFAGFFIFTIARLLIVPLVGNAGSDISRFSGRRKNSDKGSKKSNKGSKSSKSKEAKER